MEATGRDVEQDTADQMNELLKKANDQADEIAQALEESQGRLYTLVSVTWPLPIRQHLEDVGRILMDIRRSDSFGSANRDELLKKFKNELGRRAGCSPELIETIFSSRYNNYNKLIHRAFDPKNTGHRKALLEAISFGEQEMEVFAAMYKLCASPADYRRTWTLWSKPVEEKIPARLKYPESARVNAINPPLEQQPKAE